MLQRRASKNTLVQGGWSSFCSTFTGMDASSPASEVGLRGNGADAWFGWPTAPKLETLREAWFAASTAEGQRSIAAEIQRQAFIDVPYIPVGQFFETTAQRNLLKDSLSGFPIFWNIHRG